ncbi:MAG: T9SS type A sorting domain-containing protein [Ignavibacteria bacterium]
MLKQLLLAIVSVFVLSSAVFSSSWNDTLTGNITTVKTLQNNKRYLILGTVFVEQGGTLVIPAGTQLFGDKTSKASIVVKRGGYINAVGTFDAPIIFTSSQPVGSKSAGDWGGIILLGKARINTPTGADTLGIEGISPAVYFGGQTDNDSSGVMKYCRIEYPGIALSPNNEINGLTFGGVGSRTVIDYIMVSYSGDDSYEWFGGTVNCTHLIACYAVDDDFDTDNGFRGNVQFCLDVRNPNIADVSGSNGFESDNNATPNYNAPRTQPNFSNVTIVGPLKDTTSTINPNFTRGIHDRRNSLMSIANSLIMGWPTAALLDGAGTTCALQNDSSRIKSNIFSGCYQGYKSTNAGCSFDAIVYMSGNNTSYPINSLMQLTDPYGAYSTGNYSPANFNPAAGSPALTGSNFTYPGFNNFVNTTYRGAFSQNDTWANTWTNFRPDTVNYKLGPIGIQPISNVVPKSFSLQQNYPNPFNPSTKISFNVASNGFAKLVIFDVLGREVASLVNENLKAGEYAVNFNASNLPSGVYLYRLTLSGDKASFTSTKRLILVK